MGVCVCMCVWSLWCKCMCEFDIERKIYSCMNIVTESDALVYKFIVTVCMLGYYFACVREKEHKQIMKLYNQKF